MTNAADLEAAYQHCADLLANLDRDRYLASLFISAPNRSYIQALWAFSLEVARIRDIISEPMPGEIRLQWWRDVILAGQRDGAQGHPVAAALMDVMVRFSLPQKAFLDVIEARSFDLYDDPMPSLNDLEGYCGETTSALYHLAALILAEGDDLQTTDLAGHAGVADGITWALRSVGFHAQRGQIYLPQDKMDQYAVSTRALRQGRVEPGLGPLMSDLAAGVDDHLAKVRAALQSAPREIYAAFLPLCLVPLWLRQINRAGPDLLLRPVRLAPWKAPLALWWAARRKKII